MTTQDLIHTHSAIAWREFSSSIKNKKYGLFKTTIYAEIRFNKNVDDVLDALESRPSDDVIIVSEKAFKQLQAHRYTNGEPILKQLEEGLFSYMQRAVLRCKDGARIQSCCYYISCNNYYHLDFVVCSIDSVDMIE